VGTVTREQNIPERLENVWMEGYQNGRRTYDAPYKRYWLLKRAEKYQHMIA
jgi:hypothetical protein